MSKRDDDSASDMEVGMTTAERRRRRRRGGGLRVPSDNVPRRSQPPVVAPVPEDPSLAMSIAYSFTNDASEPIPRVEPPLSTSISSQVRADGNPRFEPMAPDAMATVIDPPSAPVEAGDFEMKTREMTAVDLEALGLKENQALSNPEILAPSATTTLPGLGSATARRQDTTQSGEGESTPLGDDDLMPVRAASDSGSQQPLEAADVEIVEDRSSELEIEIAVDTSGDNLPVSRDSDPGTSATGVPRVIEELRSGPAMRSGPIAIKPMTPAAAPPTAVPVPTEPSWEETPVPAIQPAISRRERLKTVALSDEDLEEVREAVRAATNPTPAAATFTPPGIAALTPSANASGARPVPPPSTPPINQPRTTTPPMRPHTPTPPPPPAMSFKNESSQPGLVPPPITSKAAEPKVDPTNRTQPLTALDVEPVADVHTRPTASHTAQSSGSAPEIDIQDLERAAESSGEIEVSIDETDSDKQTVLLEAVAAPSENNGEPRRRPPSIPPPIAPSAAQTNPGAHAHPPPVPPESKAKTPPAPPKLARSSSQKLDKSEKPIDKPADAKRGKPWFLDLFDEDYLRTLPFLTPQATQAEAEFVLDAMNLQPGAQVLDVGCGYGRHAMEVAARGFHVVGLDVSTPLLVRGGEEAHRRGLQINFIRGDMRELDYEAQFDGAYCLFSTFGYFDDETNKKTVANIARALKPGGKVLIEILNRDYVIADLPTRVWWEGDGCVVLEEVELNYFSSRIQVNRSVVFDDGRQLEQEISVRAYSLHEVGKLMHAAGFRVLEVSGGYHTRGRFFGNQSRHIIVLAERKETPAS